MSNTEPRPEEVPLRASVVRAVDVIEGRKAAIGDGTEVRRLLPKRELRTIGAWCFLDHYGPDDTSAGEGMRVPPHPHIGLQTASWLFDGAVLHRDSLGSEQLIRPGELNLMTSGRGIAHSEESPEERPALLHGVQLWIALPDGKQDISPAFTSYGNLPVIDDGPARITVVAGEHGGERSPATVFSPMTGLEVALLEAGEVTLPAAAGFEYGVLAADGPAAVACPASTAPVTIAPGQLAHLPVGVPAITLSAPGPSRFFVVGGVPFGEKLVMWWNFVARTAEEIRIARETWENGDWDEVHGYPYGARLAAPPLPPGLKPR
ncbi:MAG: pirin family protein [Streptosporangiales bacterium]|nr:pirin family protein [Streptosporangiales bacterium]